MGKQIKVKVTKLGVKLAGGFYRFSLCLNQGANECITCHIIVTEVEIANWSSLNQQKHYNSYGPGS